MLRFASSLGRGEKVVAPRDSLLFAMLRPPAPGRYSTIQLFGPLGMILTPKPLSLGLEAIYDLARGSRASTTLWLSLVDAMRGPLVSPPCRHGNEKSEKSRSNTGRDENGNTRGNELHRMTLGKARKARNPVLGTGGRRFESCCPDQPIRVARRVAFRDKPLEE
jgi:hypothetical protein